VIVVKRILKMEKKLILRETLQGSRHWSNYFWAVIISLGGLGFLIVGLSSFFEVNLIQFLDSKNITFFPQGLVMCFYGIVGLLLGRATRWRIKLAQLIYKLFLFLTRNRTEKNYRV
jgi:hypothetical protein